jgi:predicted phosphodiesterase
MRIAILSDVHGNRFALEAVLREIEAAGCELIANLGDQVWGAADPAGAWELQQALGARAVRGNTDEMLSSGFEQLTEMKPYAEWVRGLLPEDAPAKLAALPLAAELAGGEVVLAHGALDDTWGALLYDLSSAEPRQAEALAAYAETHPQARVFVVGHTHRELLRTVRGVTFVNAGPVSRPFDGLPLARWLLLEERSGAWSATFKRTPYDLEAAVAWALEHSPFGEQEEKLLRGQAG